MKLRSKKITELEHQAEDTIMVIKSMFPFTIFRDKIDIDHNKVTITYKRFFNAKTVFPIYIKDIKTVKVSTSLLFGQISFEIKGYEQNPEPVGYLPKNAAIRARKVITGLVASKRKEIDTHKLPNKKFVDKAKKIGN